MTELFNRSRAGGRIAFSGRIAGDLPARGYTARDRQRDFKHVFEAGAEGRRVLAQLLMRCQVWERSYVTADTHESARREGMRDIGLWIMELINTEPVDGPETAATEEESRNDSRSL